MAFCPDPEDTPEVKTLMDGFYKWAMNMGVTWFFRTLKRRISTKNKRGWNRPFVEELRDVVKQSLRKRYPDEMPRGIQLVDKAIDSVMVLADDDDVYFYILRNAVRDIIDRNFDVPQGNGFSEELKRKLREKNKDIIVKRE